LRHDTNEVAFDLVQRATGQKPKASGKNPEAVKRGRKGGKRGGKERSAKLTARRRSAIAKKAAQRRWTKSA